MARVQSEASYLEKLVQGYELRLLPFVCLAVHEVPDVPGKMR